MQCERRNGISDKMLMAAVTLLRKQAPGLVGAWLFGSAVEGRMRPDSDADIAILTEAPLDAWRRLELAADLTRLFGREVDLVDLRQSSTVMRMQAVVHGRRIFCSDETRCEAFEDFVFSDYARFLAVVLARESVHE